MTARSLRLGAVAAIASALIGCAHAPKPIYHWEGFQGQLYEHFKSDSSGPDAQLRILEEQMLKARVSGEVLPPGFRAHLAMVYLRLGRPDEARLQLEAEKASFPESSQYMNFLLKGMAASKS